MFEFRVTADSPPFDPASRDCAALLTLLGGYAGVMGLMAIPVGLFVGPHILFMGLASVAFALLTVLLIHGLNRRHAAARWGVRVVAVTVAALGGAGAAAAWAEGPGGAVFWGVVCLAGLTLLTRSWWLPAAE